MKSTPTPRIRRALAGLAVAGTLAISACGSDDAADSGDDAVSTEAFCTELGALAATEEGSISAELQSLADSAPDAITDDMQAFSRLFGELDALSTDESDEAAAQMAELFGEYEDVTSRLDIWANDNCPELPENVFTEG
jgi:hypothetical protein